MLQTNKQVDTAVMIAKLAIILLHLNYGTSEQKKKARLEYRKVEGELSQILDDCTIQCAINRLTLSEEDLIHLETTSV